MRHKRQNPISPLLPRWYAWVLSLLLFLLAGLLLLGPQGLLTPAGRPMAQWVLALLIYGVVWSWLWYIRLAETHQAYKRAQQQSRMHDGQGTTQASLREYSRALGDAYFPSRTMKTLCIDRGNSNMQSQLRPALVSLGILTLLTGLLYPLVVTALAQALFPWQANGSLIERNGRLAGSALIGQPFDDPKYFWGRLSATSPASYTAFNADKLTGSSGSNYGPLNPALLDAVQGRIKALHDADPTNTVRIPVDLVTASGSGLDPHISPAAATYQVGRVARERGLSEATVRQLVAQHTEGRTLGILGEARVNVLQVNLALDKR
jgi:potassium-transporting ATPase KdpC subunit